VRLCRARIRARRPSARHERRPSAQPPPSRSRGRRRPAADRAPAVARRRPAERRAAQLALRRRSRRQRRTEHGARRGDFDEAFAHFELAWRLARTDGAAALKAAVAYTGASLAHTIDDTPAAIEGYRLAEDAFRADGDPLGESDSARALAGLLVGAGRYTEADERLSRALARYHALDDDFGVATGTALLARTKSGLGNRVALAADAPAPAATGETAAVS